MSKKSVRRKRQNFRRREEERKWIMMLVKGKENIGGRNSKNDTGRLNWRCKGKKMDVRGKEEG